MKTILDTQVKTIFGSGLELLCIYLSRLPVLVAGNEVAQHVEGSLGLVSWHHVTRMVHQHEPEVCRDLGPSCVLPMDGPDLLLGSFPHRDASPIESIEIVQHTRGVDHEIVLSVVNQHLHIFVQEADDLSNIGAGDVSGKGLVDIVVAWDVVDIIGHSETGSAVVEESGE